MKAFLFFLLAFWVAPLSFAAGPFSRCTVQLITLSLADKDPSIPFVRHTMDVPLNEVYRNVSGTGTRGSVSKVFQTTTGKTFSVNIYARWIPKGRQFSVYLTTSQLDSGVSEARVTSYNFETQNVPKAGNRIWIDAYNPDFIQILTRKGVQPGAKNGLPYHMMLEAAEKGAFSATDHGVHVYTSATCHVPGTYSQ